MAGEEPPDCVICWDAKPDCALVPCGHCFCRSCGPGLVSKACPTCNKACDGVLMLFVPDMVAASAIGGAEIGPSG
jgi:hypothetical protein